MNNSKMDFIDNIDEYKVVLYTLHIYIISIRTSTMIRAHYIESAGLGKKESDKQIIHHKSTKHIPYISITGFTSLFSNKKYLGFCSLSRHHMTRFREAANRSKKTSKFRVTALCVWNSPGNSPHKGPVARNMFPLDDVIMK